MAAIGSLLDASKTYAGWSYFAQEATTSLRDRSMEKRKIAVIYDTSYLMGEFQSIKKFIMSRRFSSKEKQGLWGS